MGVGTDLVHVPRLAGVLARHPGFAARVYTPTEIAYCKRHREPSARYAARFAAKEAVLKALGTGLARGMRWQDVEVVSGPDGGPRVILHGRYCLVQYIQPGYYLAGNRVSSVTISTRLGPGWPSALRRLSVAQPRTPTTGGVHG